jgi:hypothetical protein
MRWTLRVYRTLRQVESAVTLYPDAKGELETVAAATQERTLGACVARPGA